MRVIVAIGLTLALLPIYGVQKIQAASASFNYSPATVNINVGQSATITLRINATDQAINAADGTIVVPSSQVAATSVSKSGSIFSNWPEEPSISGAAIRFAGGLPTPGYQGSSGKVISFTIKGTAEGTGLITTSSGRILANTAQGTNIYSGSNSVTVVVTRTVSGATISSSSHPDPSKWYKAQDVKLSWSKPSGASSFSYNLSSASGTKTGSGPSTSAEFAGLADGIWTFSLTTTYSDGKTASSSFTIRIDTVPPESFSFTTERVNGSTDPAPILKFQTSDSLSGIAGYDIIIDGGEPIRVTENSYQLAKQLPGQHSIIIRAIDNAGNSVESVGKFNVDGFPGPIITSWPKYISALEPIFLKGKGRFDSKVLLYIDGTKIGEFNIKENLSDEARKNTDVSKLQPDSVVEWSYTFHGTIAPGPHLIYAHQERPDGALSDRSNEVRTTVIWTVVTIGKYRIPTILIGLIGVIVLSIILVVTWYRFRHKLAYIRRKTKHTQAVIDQDLENLEKDIGNSSPTVRSKIELTKTSVDSELDGIFKKSKDEFDKGKPESK